MPFKGWGTNKSEGYYERALTLAQQAGEQRMLGMFMANLAELSRDRAAWEEALRILERSGHRRLADEYRSDLPANHPFRHEDHAQDGT